MKRPVRAVAAGLLALAAGAAAAQPAAPRADRGALLYDTHCGACHSSKMHWRDAKAATGWPSLKAQVRRWQGEQRLEWSEADIDAVARYLNERYYRFESPQPVRWRTEGSPWSAAAKSGRPEGFELRAERDGGSGAD